MTLPSRTPPSSALPDTPKWLDLERGPLCYRITGSGPAVLMIQGVGVVGEGWRPQVSEISRLFTTVTIDNRGIGGSAARGDPLTIEAMAADALAVADAEGLDRFHLVGHSMGGLIALHVALTASRRVKSLALLCTFADGKDGSRLKPSMILLGLRTRLGTRAMRRNAMLELIMPAAYLHGADRSVLGENLKALFGRDLADQPPIIMAQLRAMSRYAATPRLWELAAIPTLVVSGAHDRIAPPRLGRALAAAMGSARYVELEDAGHALPIQCASELNTLIMDHLAAAEDRGDR